MIKIECPSIKELTLQYPDEALKIFSDSGIIDKEAALVSWYFDMRNKKVDKIHQYKIWQSSSDRKWRTYIEKSDGNRKLIALKDKESLLRRKPYCQHSYQKSYKTDTRRMDS